MNTTTKNKTTTSAKNNNRKAQIMQALARELELNPGKKVTTANLAKAVGVSEAALYRHFPSKAKMFEALIEYSEEVVFGLIKQVLDEPGGILSKIEKIMRIVLSFSTKNPGITRILLGDALVGEHERLRKRTDQFFQRIETQLRQVLREGELQGQLKYQGNMSQFAEILSSFIEGQLSKYVRTQFKNKPDENWVAKWLFFVNSLKPSHTTR